MGRKGHKAKQAAAAKKAAEARGEDPPPAAEEVQHGPSDPSFQLAIHPNGETSATAFGTEVRVFDASSGAQAHLVQDSQPHSENVQAIEFDRTGKFMVTAGDDKLVKLWQVDGWKCLWTVTGPKKVSAAAFSSDGRWLTFSDKYGDVYVVPTEAAEAPEAALLLGHFCSIITSLAFSPDSRLVATADRDMKVRINIFPASPLEGAHEIQSFCLGHESFVRDIHFLPWEAGEEGQGRIVSGGGDGTLRLWDVESGALLDTCSLREGSGEPLPVVAMAGSAGRSVVAAVLQGSPEVVVVECAGAALKVAQRLPLPGLELPSALSFDSGGNLWAFGLGSGGETRVELAAAAGGKFAHDGGEAKSAARAALGGVKVAAGAEKVAAGQVQADWKKRQYNEEDLLSRKRQRNDMKGQEAK